jgi:2-polyprenyl-3-methyl-5-hydroxy-6-metoxy-1,4-benzoquinol methylase
MPSFKQRSYQKELLDSSTVPFSDIKRNMQELDYINKNLGGHAITLKGLKSLLKSVNSKNDPLLIIEIGCGGGDNLRVIKNWAAVHGCNISLEGIDINKECISYAESLSENGDIKFICSDYKDVVFQQRPDIIFSSLFCHHFTDDELVFMLQWMKQNSSIGFFINDLHRHSLAYHSIKMLTQIFSKSYLVKNDAPLSVMRGFKRKEWEKLFAEAGIGNFRCRWKWAFRWLIIFES